MTSPVAEIIHALEKFTVDERRTFQDMVKQHPNLGWICQPSGTHFAELSSDDQADRDMEVEDILASIEGSWGNLSREEIDTRLANQRRFDWGE